jgi:hypothetical protein
MMKLVLGPLIQSRLWCESRNSCAVCLWLGWTFILRASYDYMCYNSVLRQPLDWKRRPRAQISIMVDLLLRRKRGTTKQILHCVLVTFGSADGHSGPTFSPLLRWIALTSINYGPLHYVGIFKKALWKTLLKLSIGAFVVDSRSSRSHAYSTAFSLKSSFTSMKSNTSQATAVVHVGSSGGCSCLPRFHTPTATIE